MTAQEVLTELAGRGIELRRDGGRLQFRPVAAMTPELLCRVRAVKGDLLAILATADLDLEAVTPDKLRYPWREWYEERAAVREFDGGQSREHAEAEALRETLEKMRAAGESA